jgi:hypothetical protein
MLLEIDSDLHYCHGDELAYDEQEYVQNRIELVLYLFMQIDFRARIYRMPKTKSWNEISPARSQTARRRRRGSRCEVVDESVLQQNKAYSGLPAVGGGRRSNRLRVGVAPRHSLHG